MDNLKNQMDLLKKLGLRLLKEGNAMQELGQELMVEVDLIRDQIKVGKK